MKQPRGKRGPDCPTSLTKLTSSAYWTSTPGTGLSPGPLKNAAGSEGHTHTLEVTLLVVGAFVCLGSVQGSITHRFNPPPSPPIVGACSSTVECSNHARGRTKAGAPAREVPLDHGVKRRIAICSKERRIQHSQWMALALLKTIVQAATETAITIRVNHAGFLP